MSSKYDGFVLVDKPSGISSHDVVAKIRKASGQRRVGHTGTLDPLATGLMVILLGQATKLEPWLTKMDKAYTVGLEFGLATDTDDISGQIIRRHQGPWPDEASIRHFLENNCGPVDQVPPAFSAIKVAGQRAYKAARAGKPLDLTARSVTAYSLKMTDYQAPQLQLLAEVSSGYYIRSLVRDLGNELVVGATMTALCRHKVGSWSLTQADKLEDIQHWSDEDWQKISSPAEALPHLPKVHLDEALALRFCQGQCIVPLGDLAQTGHHKVLNAQDQLLGLGEAFVSLGDSSPQGPFLRPLRVLNQNG